MWYRKQGQKPMWMGDSTPQRVNLSDAEKQKMRIHWQSILDKAVKEDDFETAANMRDHIAGLEKR